MHRLTSRLGFVLLCLSLLPGVSLAASQYISDELFVYMHSGPSNKYRITGTVNSGEQVQVLSRNRETGYTQIRTPRNKTGWIVGKYLSETPVARQRLPQVEKKLTNQQQQLDQAAEREAKLEAELEKLRQNRQQATAQLEADKQQLADQLRTLTAERNQLQERIDKMDESLLMQWFIKGSMVMAGGILLGLLLPLLFRRQKSQPPGWA